MTNRIKYDNPNDFYLSQGVWSTNPDLISDTFREKRINNHSYDIAHQQVDILNQNHIRSENHNIDSTNENKKFFRKLGVSAIVAFSLIGYVFNENQKTTIDESISQIEATAFLESGLSNIPDNPKENYEIAIKHDGKYREVILKEGDAIRTNDKRHPRNSDFNDHSALAQMEDDTKFIIEEGDIYQTPNGKIAVKSSNLKQTFSLQETGIKFELDSDDWSVIDASPEELKVVYDPNNTKQYD